MIISRLHKKNIPIPLFSCYNKESYITVIFIVRRYLSMIIYFTGTGNSAFIAQKLAAALDDSLLCINDRLREKKLKKIHSEKPLVFVTPTYAWRLPKVVAQWIRRETFIGCQNAYFVMTCGASIGDAATYLKRLCRRKSFTYMGVMPVIMPENYLAMFEVPEEPEAIATVMRAELVVAEIAELISSGIIFTSQKFSLMNHLLSGPVNAAFVTFFMKDNKFLVKEECIRCGKCVEACPLHNIQMVDNVPVWNHKCTHCMRCITECPVEAIEYGASTFGKRRYHCPEDSWNIADHKTAE